MNPLHRYLSFVVAATLVSTFSWAIDVGADEDPVSVYADLDGSWKGTFVGYSAEGAELYRIAVEQTYVTIDANTQTVEITDTMSDGSVVTGIGKNIAERAEDGTLTLICRVEKSNGDRVVHEGRVVEGADGDKQLVWHSKSADSIETFREVVVREGDADFYTIDGMGKYGDSFILMHGRYQRQ